MVKSKKSQIGLVALIVVVVLIIIAGLFLYNNGSLNLSSNSDSEGRVVFAITDAAANMGSISNVYVTVDKVEAYSSSQGWVTLSSNSRQYDLIELKSSGQMAVIADTEVQEGSYDKARLSISKVFIVDAEGSHEAKLPSNKLEINANWDVDANQTATATFDFIADESIHVTGNGEYILAPVVQVETRNDAVVEAKGNNRVEIKGGEVKTNVKVGTDVNGNVGVGLRIPVDVAIGANGVINIGGSANSDSQVETNGSGNGGVGIGIYG